MRGVLLGIGALSALATAVWYGAPAPSQEPLPPPPDAASAPAVADPDVNVQARGPVHEAYAQPLEPKPQPGPVVPKRP
ncbi:MAG TPA: hypothetical protein VJ739_09545, partial [Gemmataceae bacterium]|nr:hypothetical protein [Gemmataceae bacterium]